MSRRVGQEPEWPLPANVLAQPVDIDVRIGGRERRVLPGLDEYFQHGLVSALEWMTDLVGLGVRRFVVRVTAGSLESGQPMEALLERHAEALGTLRNQMPEGEIEITVDPFSIALNADGTWGVRGPIGLDRAATNELIHAVATVVRGASADAILTLGRAQDEVSVSQAALAGSHTRIWSFSANTETPNAYVYSASEGSPHDTGQKILVGNTTEMVLRGLTDVAAGTSTVVVKPVENLHVVSALCRMLDDSTARQEFLGSPRVGTLVNGCPDLQRSYEVLCHLHEDETFGRDCQVGTYTVSGTSSMTDLVRSSRGETIANALVAERFATIASAAGDRLGVIVDRGVHRHVRAGLT